MCTAAKDRMKTQLAWLKAQQKAEKDPGMVFCTQVPSMAQKSIL